MARNQQKIEALILSAVDLLRPGETISYAEWVSRLNTAGIADAVAHMTKIRNSGRVKFAVSYSDEVGVQHTVSLA